MSRYLGKQLSILFVFSTLILAIGVGIYFIINGQQPNCYDGAQNQGEIGIDCGGPCGPCPGPRSLNISYSFLGTD
jgi:hypothetical protein